MFSSSRVITGLILVVALGALVALGTVLRDTPSTEQELMEVPAATTPSGEDNDPQADDGLLVVNLRDLYPEGRPSPEVFTGEMVTELPEMEIISNLFVDEFARNPEDQGVISWYISPYDGRIWVETLEGYGEAAANVLYGLDVLTRRVVDIGETFVVELELSSSPTRSNEGLSCLTLMPGSLLPVE